MPGSNARSLPDAAQEALLLAPMLRHPPVGSPKPLFCQPLPASASIASKELQAGNCKQGNCNQGIAIKAVVTKEL